MAWLTAGYHFISSLVQCGVEHSAQVVKTGLDLAVCVSGKFFH